ncbi:GmrSD restriction endonuclease domain-containing protein [Actinotalea caeni]|uniref:GmrSD restriction endonuclease domain-containing protein n=1 Tax=Actinotalea caeni TaxID=1348467 RepID=UPI001F03EE40|nr:DUF1524 domain-containing protein [Actinotalea caeni]
MTRTRRRGGRRARSTRGRPGFVGAVVGLLLLISCGAALSDVGEEPGLGVAPTPVATRALDPADTAEPTVDEDPTAVAPTDEPTETAEPGTALALLAELRVAGRAPRTGYDRDLFEYRSYDSDRNGCDVRNDILRRDLTDVLIKPGTQGCVVLTGMLHDPYSGQVLAFDRQAADDVQIDHVVALSDAWQKGAQGWDAQTMREFGNDPLNLLAVDGRLNGQKGDGDAATWLPPNKRFRCEYVARQITVKHTYGLWVTQAEHDAMARVLADCPDQAVVERVTAPLGGPEGDPEQSSTPTTTPTQEPTAPDPAADGDTDPRFGSCKDAKAEGYGPYVRGVDPEYDWYRDGDADGIVCE